MGTVSFASLLNGIGDLMHVEAGETIYHPGSPSSSVFLIVEGLVTVAYLDESGEKLTLAIRGPEDIIGEFGAIGEKFRRHLATAIDGTVLRCISRKDFVRIVFSDIDATRLLMLHFAETAREYEQLAESLAFRPIRPRVALILLRLASKYGTKVHDGTLIDIPWLTHKALADMIGARRESVTLALGRMEREGLITKWRYCLVIKNCMGLEGIVGVPHRKREPVAA